MPWLPAMFHSITTDLTAPQTPQQHPKKKNLKIEQPCVSGHGHHDDDQDSNIPQVFLHMRTEGWCGIGTSETLLASYGFRVFIRFSSVILVLTDPGICLRLIRQIFDTSKTVVTWPCTLQSGIGWPDGTHDRYVAEAPTSNFPPLLWSKA